MSAVLFILLQSFIPWYLTPTPEPAKQVEPSTPEKTAKEAPAPRERRQSRQAAAVITLEAAADSVKTAVPMDSVAQFKETIDVAILLPESVQGGVDGNMVDFYNGALMASRELGLKGRRMRIHAYDVAKDMDAGQVAQCDIILGPVSPADILAVNSICGKGAHIISPLEPRSAGLADSLAIVQVPTPSACQIKDNVAWIKEEMGPTDEVIVICPDEQTAPGPNHEILMDALAEQGLSYKRLTLSESVALYEVPKTDDPKVEIHISDTTRRVLIDGTDELFVTNVLREMTARCLEGNKMIVYHQSRVRSYENLKIEYMHNCNLHVSASYNVDYSDEAVRTFVREYRSLFEAEPNSFAFHGYDCMNYFITAYNKFGSLWFESLEEFRSKGLNATFEFKNQDKAGKTNSGIRRIVYNPDWSISAQ